MVELNPEDLANEFEELIEREKHTGEEYPQLDSDERDILFLISKLSQPTSAEIGSWFQDYRSENFKLGKVYRIIQDLDERGLIDCSESDVCALTESGEAEIKNRIGWELRSYYYVTDSNR